MQRGNGQTATRHPIDAKQYMRTLRRCIRIFEQRYEMPSEQMSKVLNCSHDRETAEVLKWMQAYRVLTLLEKKTRTTG